MERLRRRFWRDGPPRAAAVAWLLVACATPAPVPFDASIAPDAGEPSVQAPGWGACPAGWRPRAMDGAATCVPPARAACVGATFQRVGGDACEPVDDHCGATRFPTDLAADRAHLYVDEGAAPGGDGTEARPFRSIDEAVSAGTSPMSIALAAGTYVSTIALPADIEIHGACADLVHITAVGGAPAISVGRGDHAILRGLTLSGAGAGVLSEGQLDLAGIVVDETVGVGIGLLEGTLVGSRILVRGTQARPDGSLGRGLSLGPTASAMLRDVVIEHSREAGIAVGTATLDARGLAVLDTSSTAEGRYGAALAVFAMASVTLRESLLAGASEAGVTVDGNSSVSLDAVVIEDIQSETVIESGEGILLRDSHADLARVSIARASRSALSVLGSSTATARDFVAEQIQARMGFGSGLVVLGSGSLEVERVALFDTAGAALMSSGGTLRATGVRIERVAAASDLGIGLLVWDGGSAEIDDFHITQTHVAGVMVSGASSHVLLSHGRVEHVLESARFAFGRGVEADVGASAVLRSVTIEDVVETGLMAYGEDVPTQMALTDVAVRRIAERSCASTTCSGAGGGTGVASLFGATLTAEDLDVSGAALCGVQVTEASLDVLRGSIAESAIGACVQVEGYDLARIVATVRFVDDERNVETASVYVPSRGPTP